MDTYRDKLCDGLARKLYLKLNEIEGFHLPSFESELWEWLEGSDYATEELETITTDELIAGWREYSRERVK